MPGILLNACCNTGGSPSRIFAKLSFVAATASSHLVDTSSRVSTPKITFNSSSLMPPKAYFK
jgi:hypothetical protein